MIKVVVIRIFQKFKQNVNIDLGYVNYKLFILRIFLMFCNINGIFLGDIVDNIKICLKGQFIENRILEKYYKWKYFIYIDSCFILRRIKVLFCFEEFGIELFLI